MIMKMSLAAALILLTQNPVLPGVRVSGHVVGLPPGTPSGMMRANMIRMGAPPQQALGNLVDAEGRFEFPDVPPGPYTLRIIGPNTSGMPVTVANSDISDLVVMLPPQILGHAKVEGGSELPRQVAGGTVLPAMLQFDAIRIGGGAGKTGITPRGDGPFLISIPAAGGYLLRPTILPIGYELKSMNYGNIDLVKQPLSVTVPPSAETVEVILTKTSQPRFHVSGRVTGLPAPTGNLTPVRRVSIATIRTETSPQTGLLTDTQYSAEVLLNPDGSFDISGVTPGRYILQVPGVPSKPLDISTADITRLDFSVVPSAPVIGTNLLFQLQSAFPVPSPAATADSSTLVVSQSGRGPMYIEGALSYFRVASSDVVVDEKRLEGGASFRLSPGNYELIAFSRPCNGNCGNPFAPSDECRTSITLAMGETVEIDRVLAGATCSLQIKSRR